VRRALKSGLPPPTSLDERPFVALAQSVVTLLLVERQDHEGQVGRVGVRPASGCCPVPSLDRQRHRIDIGQVLDAALKYFGRRRTEQIFDFCHTILLH